MKTSKHVHADPHTIIRVAREKFHGFLNATQVDALAEKARFTQILVRTNMGRFVCNADCVKHFVDVIERDGVDYVRDVSLPAKGR